MKKIFTKLSVILVVLATTFSTTMAQTENFGLKEVDPYFSAYLKPFGQAMATSLSGGWTHTAKVHGTLGFDITFSGSYVKVPSSDFNINTTDLNMPKYDFGIASTVPTIAGKQDSDLPEIKRKLNNGEISDVAFEALKGGNVNFGGMFAVQAAVGLPKGTELIVRLMPDISKSANNALSSNDISLEKTNMWGLGVKHDIKQWIPVVAKVPFLQISGLFSYSKFQTGFSGEMMTLDPERFELQVATDAGVVADTWDNQKFSVAMSSFTGNLLVGANIPVFQPYIGLGFNSSNFEAGFKGNYPTFEINTDDDSAIVDGYETDPLTSSSKETNFNFQAGARLKLGFFVFHYTFTAQKYKMHTGGIAFTFR